VTRQETGQFCQDQDLPIWVDQTNQDLRYGRNRIRQELLPYLSGSFNPQVDQTLARTAELLQADVDALEDLATQLCQRSIHQDTHQDTHQYALQPMLSDPAHPPLDRPALQVPLKLQRHVLRQAALAIQRRAMRQILQAILPHHPNFNQVEKLTALIQAPNRSQTDPFPGGMVAVVDGEWICLRYPGNESSGNESPEPGA